MMPFSPLLLSYGCLASRGNSLFPFLFPGIHRRAMHIFFFPLVCRPLALVRVIHPLLPLLISEVDPFFFRRPTLLNIRPCPLPFFSPPRSVPVSGGRVGTVFFFPPDPIRLFFIRPDSRRLLSRPLFFLSSAQGKGAFFSSLSRDKQSLFPFR